MHAAKIRCQHVRVIAKLVRCRFLGGNDAYGNLRKLASCEKHDCAASSRNFRWSIMYLLKRMTEELSIIHVLCKPQHFSYFQPIQTLSLTEPQIWRPMTNRQNSYALVARGSLQ